MQTDCKQSLRIGKISALNGCAVELFVTAIRHSHKNSDITVLYTMYGKVSGNNSDVDTELSILVS